MSTILSTGDALLASVRANPADDLPRLAYADWLQENGQDERAEFIRCQVEMARMEDEGEPCEIDPHEGHTCCEDPCPVCVSVEKYTRLRSRTSHLHRTLVRPIPSRSGAEIVEWVSRRGFWDTVICPWETICAIGPRLFGGPDVVLTHITLTTWPRIVHYQGNDTHQFRAEWPGQDRRIWKAQRHWSEVENQRSAIDYPAYTRALILSDLTEAIPQSWPGYTTEHPVAFGFPPDDVAIIVAG